MKRNIDTRRNKGFSLLEMTVVIIIITILATAVIPALTRAFLEKAGNKTALDMSAIEESARAYYINNGAWPGTVSGNPMGDLTGGNYLPSSWKAINPFGVSSAAPSNYNYNISVPPSGLYLTVYTYVPIPAQPIIENLLPSSGVDASNNVYSSVTVPGGVIHSFGTAITVVSGQVYKASTDGFLEGNTFTSHNIVGFNILSDSNPTPNTVLPECNQGTYSGNNGGYYLQAMVHCLIYKGNYYQFNLLSGEGYTVNFIPLNS